MLFNSMGHSHIYLALTSFKPSISWTSVHEHCRCTDLLLHLFYKKRASHTLKFKLDITALNKLDLYKIPFSVS